MREEKSKEEISNELRDLKLEQSILEKGKALFAEKRVEIILYAFITMILMAAAAAWIAQIINKHPTV